MSAKSETTLTWMILVGVGLALAGFALFFLGFTQGIGSLGTNRGNGAATMAIFGLILGVVGIVVLGIAVFSGLAASKMQHSGRREMDRHAKVLAKYAFNKRGEPIFADWEWDEPGTRFYVRMANSAGQSSEYECQRAVWDSVGEGMSGEATFQGKWLGSFRPYIGGVPQQQGPLPGQDPLKPV